MPSRLSALRLPAIRLSALCFATLCVAPLCPATAAPAQTKLPTLAYETYTLPNGLKVITHVDHRLPLVAVDLWYHVGPLNERPGRTGFAHLFEHMMFEGSEHVGEKAHLKYVEAAGGTGINGTTNFDRTNYFETMPANQLELALWLESDRMGFLMEGLNRDLLKNQRDVVRNERRQSEGSPYYLAYEEIFHQLFPKDHPYYGRVLGSHADIEAARIEDVRDFHQHFYTPNNASLAIAGDFDPANLKELLTKYFGPIPAGPKVPPVTAATVVTPPITAQKRVTVTDTVKLSQLSISWLAPPIFAPGMYDLDAAMYALGLFKASRLRQALVYRSQMAQNVTCSNRSLKLVGIANCTITAKPGVKLEDLEKTTWEEIAKLQQTGPTPQEIEAYKASTLSETITGLQTLGGFGGIADTLNQFDLYTGDPGYLSKDVAATEAVTSASTQKAVARYLTRDSAVVIYCVPGKKVVDDVPQSPADTDANVKITNPYTPEFEASQSWRKTVPKPGPAITVHLPVPQTFSLPNGLKVYVVEQNSLPVVSASLVARAGSENNSPEMAGLASLTAQLMGEATTTRNLTQLAEDQERIGTSIRVGASEDAATTSMTVLTQYVGKGMDLFSDVVQHPAFTPADIDRLRKQRLLSIQQETDNVQAMASRVGPHLVYGDQPYGISGTGTPASIAALTHDDITKFYVAHYAPSDSALVLVGDITLPAARHVAETYFGKWSGPASSPVTIPSPPQLPPTHVVIVDKPGAPQTALFAFGTGVPVNVPDMPAVEVMNDTLGGVFPSRINMNLREVHGYTYGAFSRFQSYRGGGPFQAGGLVRTNVTGPAARELMGEIIRFPNHPPTTAELNDAKDARVQSLPGFFETDTAIASSMSSIFLYDRPLDYYATLPARYRAVTAEDVARAAQADIHPDHLIIVTAGDRAKIEPQLKDANLGPIEVRDINGNLVTPTR